MLVQIHNLVIPSAKIGRFTRAFCQEEQMTDEPVAQDPLDALKRNMFRATSDCEGNIVIHGFDGTKDRHLVRFYKVFCRYNRGDATITHTTPGVGRRMFRLYKRKCVEVAPDGRELPV